MNVYCLKKCKLEKLQIFGQHNCSVEMVVVLYLCRLFQLNSRDKFELLWCVLIVKSLKLKYLNAGFKFKPPKSDQ